MVIGFVWAICNVLFVASRLEALVDLSKVQYYGVIYLFQHSDRAMMEAAIYLLFSFGFFYAIISRFHHARKRGAVLAESFFIFIISLIIQGIVLACGYPGAEALGDDTLAMSQLRQPDVRFLLLIVLASISHVALIATITASVWQRKWHANNIGVHMLLGLPTTLAIIALSIPSALFDLGHAEWLFYLWFGSMPLTLALSCAKELSPPYLLKLSGATASA